MTSKDRSNLAILGANSVISIFLLSSISWLIPGGRHWSSIVVVLSMLINFFVIARSSIARWQSQ
jgi:hypothetical protein